MEVGGQFTVSATSANSHTMPFETGRAVVAIVTWRHERVG